VVSERTRSVLDLLYHDEEAERSLDPSYCRGRNADPRGRSLSGRIWMRGLAVRHQAELREPLFVAASSQVKPSLGTAGANARPATTAHRRWWAARPIVTAQG
jgi:hypothetical protein